MTASSIHLARELALPLNASTQAIACVGKRGSGKTYAAGRLVEEFLLAGVQVVILDGIGNWFGLRLKRDGQTPSQFKIPILGGHRADVALSPDAGGLVARTLVETGSSAVLDVSLFRKNRRKAFATAFAEELLEVKQAAPKKTRMVLVLEEAQLYIPQQTGKAGGGDVAVMLGAFEDLIKLGRNYGIGVVMISQRPQAVNKECLNQAELLLAFQMAGRHERDAIEDWISEKDAGETDIVDDLTRLETGTAIAWSPSWLKFFGRVHILEKRSFDASATPTADDIQAGDLKALDLGELAAAMTAIEEKAAADDPKLLRAKIAELEAERGDWKDEASGEAWDRIGLEVERDRLRDRVLELTEALSAAHRAHDANREKFDDLRKGLNIAASFARDILTAAGVVEGVTFDPLELTAASVAAARQELERLAPKSTGELQHSIPRPPAATNGAGLKAGARRMLGIAAAYGRQGGLSKRALSTYSGIVMGGTFSDYLSALRTRGYITDGNETVLVTAAGAEVAEEIKPTTRQVVELWSPKLKAGARRMLDALLAAAPRPLAKAELSERVGIAMGGTFSDYLSALRTKGLIDEDGRGVRASDVLLMRAR